MNCMSQRPPLAVVESVPTFFINRDKDTERRRFIEAELAGAHISAHRIVAVDGRNVPVAMRTYFLEHGRMTSKLSDGEIGCYASHLLATQQIIARGLPYGLIVEDDATLPRSLSRDVAEILSTLPTDWDVVQLGTDPSHAFKSIGRLVQGRQLVCYSRIPSGAVGYLMSAAGAKKFLTRCLREWPVDTDLRQPWAFGTNVYGVVPRLIGHSGLYKSAVLEYGERSRRRRGVHRPTLQYPCGSLFHTPHSAMFNIRRLGFFCWVRCLIENIGVRAGRWKIRATAPHVLVRPNEQAL
ncbi:glycosyltransferase family 25 protein [Hyphomicrobium sp. D-2]|uniref:glycosyltransferase family 25 protein n=1 Tax=Hyphomicrobium sp. D-2 TaxID=3041621 RepID=UPI0024548F91|nr:glycosyltransferase family 25 protein [Hyphomicrobium sp. D-2]MDH4981179.1 glycosyltransferase family 25 protein [Hyphomicrobium sp. D-2]